MLTDCVLGLCGHARRLRLGLCGLARRLRLGLWGFAGWGGGFDSGALFDGPWGAGAALLSPGAAQRIPGAGWSAEA